MTCGEFRRIATSMPLRELSQWVDAHADSHSGGCLSCGAWLQERRRLAASMSVLQGATLAMAAGPRVEGAVLAEFRRSVQPRPQTVVVAGPAPLAWRMSQIFQFGAYAAVAAAVLVALFLGMRLVRPRSTDQVAQVAVQSTPAVAEVAPLALATESDKQVVAKPVPAHETRPAPGKASSGKALAPVEAPQTADDAGYVALMFCDPLICSADTQVVRMELPAVSTGGEGDVQTRMADVVVGDDGVVRALRIVD